MKHSDNLYARAMALIPEQTMTLAKTAQQYPPEGPKYVDSAHGCRVVDVDGNTYIDYTMALGAMVLGYRNSVIEEAVTEQLHKGTVYSLPHAIEVDLAEKIAAVIPCAEKVRFYKNGADVCAMAVRLARSVTQKRHVLYTGYHGHQDWFAFTLRDSGTLDEVKPYTHHCAYNDSEAFKTYLETYPNDIAAFMIETAFDAPNPGYLEEIRTLCTRHNIALIFDEMWTGIRFGISGFQGFCGVTPDMGLFSKAIANGFPISVICGKSRYMDAFQKVWGFTTFGGETLSIRAALETLTFCETHNVAQRLWERGQQLKDGLSALIAEKGLQNTLQLKGYPCRFTMVYTPAEEGTTLKKKIQSLLLKEGILWSGQFVLSYAHEDEDIAYTLKAFDRVLTHCL